MEASKLVIFLEEVIKKTESEILHWEKTAQNQFIASIAGEFSLIISGPLPYRVVNPTHLLTVTEYYTFRLKSFPGETLVDISFPIHDSLLPMVNIDENATKIEQLYATIIKYFKSHEDRAIDKALEALKRIKEI